MSGRERERLIEEEKERVTERKRERETERGVSGQVSVAQTAAGSVRLLVFF